MAYSIFYLLSLIRGNIFLMLCFSLHVFLQVLGAVLMPRMTGQQYILIYFITFAIPLSGCLAAYIIEKNVSSLYNKEFISRLGFIIAVALCMQSGRMVDYLLAGFQAVQSKPSLELIALLMSVSGAALKCAAIVSCGLLMLINLIELPFAWFCTAFGFTAKAGVSFAGLRPTVMFLLLTSLFDYISGFITRNLWPGSY